MLRLHPRLAPVKVAVLPLVRKDGQPELAQEVRGLLRSRMQTEYDEGGAIGRRYRRQDEIGTPFCVTIDHQSLEDRTVTVRDRDSLAQERVAVDELADSSRRASPRRGARRSSAREARPQCRALIVSPNGVYKTLVRHCLNTRAKRFALIARYRAPYAPPRDPAPEPHITSTRPRELFRIHCFFV